MRTWVVASAALAVALGSSAATPARSDPGYAVNSSRGADFASHWPYPGVTFHMSEPRLQHSDPPNPSNRSRRLCVGLYDWSGNSSVRSTSGCAVVPFTIAVDLSSASAVGNLRGVMQDSSGRRIGYTTIRYDLRFTGTGPIRRFADAEANACPAVMGGRWPTGAASNSKVELERRAWVAGHVSADGVAVRQFRDQEVLGELWEVVEEVVYLGYDVRSSHVSANPRQCKSVHEDETVTWPGAVPRPG